MPYKGLQMFLLDFGVILLTNSFYRLLFFFWLKRYGRYQTRSILKPSLIPRPDSWLGMRLGNFSSEKSNIMCIFKVKLKGWIISVCQVYQIIHYLDCIPFNSYLPIIPTVAINPSLLCKQSCFWEVVVYPFVTYELSLVGL